MKTLFAIITITIVGTGCSYLFPPKEPVKDAVVVVVDTIVKVDTTKVIVDTLKTDTVK